VPVAVTVKVACFPLATLCAAGCAVMDGAVTDSGSVGVAAVVAPPPHACRASASVHNNAMTGSLSGAVGINIKKVRNYGRMLKPTTFSARFTDALRFATCKLPGSKTTVCIPHLLG
jgi:hypothetical protein